MAFITEVDRKRYMMESVKTLSSPNVAIQFKSFMHAYDAITRRGLIISQNTNLMQSIFDALQFNSKKFITGGKNVFQQQTLRQEFEVILPILKLRETELQKLSHGNHIMDEELTIIMPVLSVLVGQVDKFITACSAPVAKWVEVQHPKGPAL